MISTTSIADARVLMIGAGELVNQIRQHLEAHGVSAIETIESTPEHPEEFVKTARQKLDAFNLVLTTDQPRSLEVALSETRWPKSENDADLAMIIMRCAVNNCKFRCQYSELGVDGSKTSKFVSLHHELLPWTEEKRKLVSSAVTEKFTPGQIPTFRAYLLAALAVVTHKNSTGSWPGADEEEEVLALARSSEGNVQGFVHRICENGLASVPETISVMAWLIATDAIKLLTGTGHPINNTSLEDVIEISAAG